MTEQYEDPFAEAAPIQSNFASVQSFRGRLVLIEPVKTEMKPNQDTGLLQETVTATITTVDGKGPVEIFNRGDATGRMLPGPRHEGVWIGQEILVGQLKTADGHLRKMILTRIDTKTPGKKAMKGNPWGFAVGLPETDKQMARDFLANRTIEQAEESPF